MNLFWRTRKYIFSFKRVGLVETTTAATARALSFLAKILAFLYWVSLPMTVRCERNNLWRNCFNLLKIPGFQAWITGLDILEWNCLDSKWIEIECCLEYLEPNWSLFWWVDLQFYGLNLPKYGSFGFYVLVKIEGWRLRKKNFMTGQPTPPITYAPPRNSRPYDQGLWKPVGFPQ